MTRVESADLRQRIMYALVVSNSLSVLLYLLRVYDSGSLWYWFLLWNLLLAWIPLGLAWALTRRLENESWATAPNVLLTVAWLGFLPNSFYIVSDFIHLGATGSTLHDYVMEVAMIFSFTFNAYVAGFTSLYLVHCALLRRHIERLTAHTIVAGILFACGFAIYLGRTLRWNTWDIILKPFGLLFSIFDRVAHIGQNLDMITTTLVFFLVLGSMYAVIWQFLQLLRRV